MRNLELYIDSRLKEFKLYSYMEQILREGSYLEDDSLSIDESISLTLFKEFVDLASLLDSFQNWSDSDWSNFLAQMMIAFREKGKPDSINCALAALGIVTKGTAEIENLDTNPPTTKITVEIESIDTPNVETFLERLEQVIPKLLWTHELDVEGSVDIVRVNIKFISIYEQTMFDKAARYSLINDNNSSANDAGWGV